MGGACLGMAVDLASLGPGVGGVVVVDVAENEARGEGVGDAELQCIPLSETRDYSSQSSPGMMRRMNSSNRGTVKAVSPCAGLQIIPFTIR